MKNDKKAATRIFWTHNIRKDELENLVMTGKTEGQREGGRKRIKS